MPAEPNANSKIYINKQTLLKSQISLTYIVFNIKLYLDLGEPRLMGIRKRSGVLTTVLLLLAIFANCAMAGTCLCGQACLHGLQTKADVKSGAFIHLRCFGTLCKSCTLEKGRIFITITANPATPNVNVENLDTPLIAPTFLDYHSTNHFNHGFASYYAYVMCPSAPIYLKNRSLLC
jgi:hypothetical protein